MQDQRRRFATAALAAVISLPLAGHALASQDAAQAASRLAQARISLSQAIAAAEAHHPGSRAVQAELDSQPGQVVFDVDVLDPQQQLHEVRIDAGNGQVIRSQRDRD